MNDDNGDDPVPPLVRIEEGEFVLIMKMQALLENAMDQLWEALQKREEVEGVGAVDRLSSAYRDIVECGCRRRESLRPPALQLPPGSALPQMLREVLPKP